jgi:two-component system sensor histidine kinase AlgZ
MLARLPDGGQQAFGVALGTVCGLYGCGILALAGPAAGPMPWVASGFTGALLSSVMVVALVLRAKSRLPAETTARLAELQARIRPHFLFNSLNSAIALVREDPAKAETLLEDLSELFRHALVAKADAAPGRGGASGPPLPGHRAGALRRAAAGAMGDRPRDGPSARFRAVLQPLVKMR